MTREEFESILEEAFLEGYNDAMKEIFDEDSSFDLEEEMNVYDESSKNVRNQMDKMKYKVYRGKLDHPVKEYIPKNKNYNWVKYADKNYGTQLRGSGKDDDDSTTYKVSDNDLFPNKKSMNQIPRGRIKSGAKDSDDPRSYRLQYLLAEYKKRKKEEEIAKRNRPGIFKNKGNKY